MVASICVLIGAVLVGPVISRRVQRSSTAAPDFDGLAAELTRIAGSAGLPTQPIERQQHTGDVGRNGRTTARLSTLATTDDPDQLFDLLRQRLAEHGYQEVDVERSSQLRTADWGRKGVRITVSVQGLAGRGDQSVAVGIEAGPL